MLKIREVELQDIDVLLELMFAIAKYHGQEQYITTSKQELIDSGFGANPSYGALLAELNDQAVGYCSYTWNYSIWLGASYMNIDDLFVWEEFRGQKVGELLMLKAKEVCRVKGSSRIKWEVQQDNLGAIKFYERLGATVDIKGIARWDVI
ncbi:MAG: GNAT family N-acetyltransferase [Paraglaciecola sp.]|uniref:GNAT family N-acetyltransferase n=1 Tax=Paraglaciecola sp. TaxID=1920173 RepID=UPI003299E871